MNPGRTRPALHHLGRLLLGAVMTAGMLAGCTAAPELDRDAARQLQSRVLAVTEAAAANDAGASLQQLDDLVLQLDGAAARGQVSFQRHQSIRASVDAVRADLTAQQAAEAARVAAAEAARIAAEQEAAAQADAAAAAAQAAAAAAAAAAAPAPPPAITPAPPARNDNGGHDNGGKNSNTGKAKGKPKGNG
ncbi:mucin-associated surface protein [Micrococcaceae bacterium Sec5.8]